MYTIAIRIVKYLPLLIVLVGALATVRKWKGRNEKKTLLDVMLVIKKHIVVLTLFGGMYFVLLASCSYAANRKMMPAYSMKFNYEEAARGLFPDKTRFNASTLLNADVLNCVLQNGTYEMTNEELQDCLQVTSTFDETAVDEINPKVATEYQISFTNNILVHDVDTDQLIDDVAEASKDDFLNRYSENTTGVIPDLTGVNELDYGEIKDRLSMEAQKLRRFMVANQTKSQTFRTTNGITFQSLSKKIDDYINVGLEEYAAFVRENGITKHASSFAETTDFTNRLLQVNYDKKMASYQTRIDAIHMYDGKMASVVMVPTDDQTGEFYMSRTKIGVDYFAEEANSAINDAATLKTQMDNNEYTKDNVNAKTATKEDYALADAMVKELSDELSVLTKECMEAFNDYQMNGRESLVGIHVYHPEMRTLLSIKRNLIYVMSLEVMLILFFLYDTRRTYGK